MFDTVNLLLSRTNNRWYRRVQWNIRSKGCLYTCVFSLP